MSKDIAKRFLESAAAGHASDEASKLVTPDFRHHNAFFKGDGASLFKGMDDNARQFPQKTLTVMQALQDGDRVATLCRVQHAPGRPEFAVVHVFRFEGERIAELWDVAQEIPQESPNVNGSF